MRNIFNFLNSKQVENHCYQEIVSSGLHILEPKGVRKERMRRLKDFRVSIVKKELLPNGNNLVYVQVKNLQNFEKRYFEFEQENETDMEILEDIFFELDLIENANHYLKLLKENS